MFLSEEYPVRAALIALVLFPVSSFGQQPAATSAGQGTAERALEPVGTNPPEPAQKRIFGIIPNYRTYPTLAEYKPITPKEKFKIATQDAFDRGTFILAAGFAGKGQLENSTPSFGQGVPGYARYFGTAYCDLLVGDYMTEAIYPTLFHQDPRYFRRGAGNGWARLGYAMGQIFWTHKDSGGSTFNFSEVLGNSTSTAISNAYYPENRNFTDNVSKLGVALGIDMASNVMKEFWPDLSRKLSRKHHDNKAASEGHAH